MSLENNKMSFNGISVILPAFCRSFTPEWIFCLKRAILSVLTQECQLPLELIVIDDGSVRPINEQELLSDVFQDPRVRYVRLRNNNGLVFALNTGLNLAKYDLIARIDSDDAWRPGKLEKQLLLFDADPDLTIAGTGMRLVHEDSTQDEDLVRPGSWSGILQFTAEVGSPFPHGSILGRKSIFHLMGGYSHDVRVAHCEDFALWATWLRFFKGAMVEEVLYDYTISESAVSVKYADQQRRASGMVHAAYLRLNNYKIIPQLIERIAKSLNVSQFEAGQICFLVWQFYNFILAEGDLLDSLKMLLPDRQVMRLSEVDNHLYDRFFYFSMDTCPVGFHARCIHTIKNLQEMLQFQ